MTKSTGKKAQGSGLLFCVLSLMLLPSSRSQPIAKCPYDGLLVLRPLDPFIAVGETSTLCCLNVDPSTWEVLSEQHTDMVFTCRGGSSIVPMTLSNKTLSANSTACAMVTVTDKNQQGFCKCEVVGQPTCQASQYLTVDQPLPSTLNFSCITYGSENVTCKLEVPTFKHSKKVTSRINWAQIAPTGRQGYSVRSKVCHQHDSCVLFARDGILFGIPMELNISVVLEYDPWSGPGRSDGQKPFSVSSDWTAYNIMRNILLAPLKASVTGANSTSITIRWARQFTANSDKTVHINYLADQNGWRSCSKLEVIEKMLFISEPVEVILPALRPSTTYMIALRTKTVDSAVDLWSEPVYLTAKTHP